MRSFKAFLAFITVLICGLVFPFNQLITYRQYVTIVGSFLGIMSFLYLIWVLVES
jgi:hypothetical protein